MIKLIIDELNDNYENLLKCLCDEEMIDLTFECEGSSITLRNLDIQTEVIPEEEIPDDEEIEADDIQVENKNKGFFW